MAFGRMMGRGMMVVVEEEEDETQQGVYTRGIDVSGEHHASPLRSSHSTLSFPRRPTEDGIFIKGAG